MNAAKAMGGDIPAPEPPTLGAKMEIVASSIRAFRRRKQMTLAQFAAAANLDKGYLSRIERGQKSPSVAALLSIAHALEVQVGQLLGETATEDAITIVRAADYAEVGRSGDSKTSPIFASHDRYMLSAFAIEPKPDQIHHHAHHPGEEMLFVLDGVIEVTFPDRVVELSAGDCVRFDGHLTHRIRQKGKKKSRALVVVAFDMQQRTRSA